MIATQLIGKLGGGLVWEARTNTTRLAFSKLTLCKLEGYGQGSYSISTRAGGTAASGTFRQSAYVGVNRAETITVSGGYIAATAEIPEPN